MIKTKIVATIGPSTEDEEMLEMAEKSGWNIIKFRDINMEIILGGFYDNANSRRYSCSFMFEM